MRVLVVSHACVVNDNQRLFAELANFKDLEIALVIPSIFNTDLRGRLKPSILPNFKERVFAVRPLFAGRNRLLGSKGIHLYFYPHWWKPVREFKPDIIHIDEEPWSLCALQFALSGKRSGAKVLFYSKQNILKRLPFPFSTFERMVFGASNCAVTLTNESKAILEEKGYCKNIFVIPHAVKLSRFYSNNSAKLKCALELSGFVIGYVGRLISVKGLDVLLYAVNNLRKKVGPSPFSVIIIGGGPMHNQLKRIIRRLCLERITRVIPPVPHNKMADYYNCMDVLVLPSITFKGQKEQFGCVLIEAMACGVPAIGSSSGEIPNIIRETGGGLIFQERNVEDLAAKICGLLKDDRERKELGQRGQQKVIELYSYEVVAKQFYEVYRRLLSGKQ